MVPVNHKLEEHGSILGCFRWNLSVGRIVEWQDAALDHGEWGTAVENEQWLRKGTLALWTANDQVSSRQTRQWLNAQQSSAMTDFCNLKYWICWAVWVIPASHRWSRAISAVKQNIQLLKYAQGLNSPRHTHTREQYVESGHSRSVTTPVV